MNLLKTSVKAEWQDKWVLRFCVWSDFCRTDSWTSDTCLVFRPHHSTMYVGAAYCYRQSSMVWLLVCWSLSVGLSQSWALQKWLNQLRCRLEYRPRKSSIRWGPDPPMRRVNFEGAKRLPIVKYRDSLPWAVQQELSSSWGGWPSPQ